MNPLIVADAISKKYGEDSILEHISFKIFPSQTVGILGQSGSGKSTLIQILAGLDDYSGELYWEGENIRDLNEHQKCIKRRKLIGYIYQFHHLLSDFNALENISIPMLIDRQKQATAIEKANDLLEEIGLSQKRHHYPSQLSGGERQRIAIARAMANNPKCIIADEPTGNLDEKNSEQIYSLLRGMTEKYGCALILVTHNGKLADECQEQWHLVDSTIEISNPNRKGAEDSFSKTNKAKHSIRT